MPIIPPFILKQDQPMCVSPQFFCSGHSLFTLLGCPFQLPCGWVSPNFWSQFALAWNTYFFSTTLTSWFLLFQSPTHIFSSQAQNRTIRKGKSFRGFAESLRFRVTFHGLQHLPAAVQSRCCSLSVPWSSWSFCLPLPFPSRLLKKNLTDFWPSVDSLHNSSTCKQLLS